MCPVCGEKYKTIKYGFYDRFVVDPVLRCFQFNVQDKIHIQRYLCRNSKCKRKTFSILPFPYLRFIRHSLAFLILVLELATEQGKSLYWISKKSGRSWKVVKRAFKLAFVLKKNCIKRKIIYLRFLI